MLSLYNNSEIGQIDKFTIDSGTSSFGLIDRASKGFIKWLLTYIDYTDNVDVICGPGNNGADGYQIAIELANRGVNVTVFTLDIFDKRSDENYALQKCLIQRKDIQHHFFSSVTDLPSVAKSTLLVDALFGNGISRPLGGNIGQLVSYFNEKYSSVYAVDVPSGLLQHDQKTTLAMKCVATCSFEFPKLSFFAAEHEKFVGNWDYFSIGLSPEVEHQIRSTFYLLEKRDIANILRPRQQFAHKGLMGKALLIISNNHMMGAGHLMAKACIKMGAGYTYLWSGQKDENMAWAQLPEVIFINQLPDFIQTNIAALAIGPGLGQSDESKKKVKFALRQSATQLIIDADGLNIIASEEWQDKIPRNSIITPHIKEFERLFGKTSTHYDRITLQQKISVKLGIYIILKGRYSSISCPDGMVYYNRTGNPGLAKGGSGDVLTGMITALISQQYQILEACKIAVYVHGHAADLCAGKEHEITLIPTDVISCFSGAIRDIID